LKKEIKKHNKEFYIIFEKMYSEILAGEKFIPMGNVDKIENILEEFEKNVISSGEYNGVIYVFDEFGRYLESNINKIDVKEIQDMSEYCNDIYKKSSFFAITHKDIFQYTNKLIDKDVINEWEKVSGRFSKEHLIYEKQNIIKIIELILEKTDFYEEYYEKNKDSFVEYELKLENEIKKKNIFKESKNLAKKYYPLNYLAIKTLPSLSQKIAQNERTLFSFICGDENKALINILNEKETEEFSLVSLSELYDYFEKNFKFFEMGSTENKTYINTKNILNQLEEPLSIKIIKTLAIIYIYNNFNEIKPSKQALLLALNVADEKFDTAIKELENKEFIVFKKHLQQYKLRDEININIDKEINKEKEKSRKYDYAKTLVEIMQLNYYYPTRYNIQNGITRYLKQYYVDMRNISELSKIILEDDSDGKIIYITDIANKRLNKKRILEEYGENAVFIFSKETKLEIAERLDDFEIIKKLKIVKKEFSLNDLVQQEIEDYILEIKELVKEKITNYFNFKNIEIYIYGKKQDKRKDEKQYMELISQYMSEKYEKYIKKIQVNYELINKNNLTSQIKRIRINLLKKVDQNQLDYYDFNKTGSENSVARNILKNTKIFDRKFNFEKSNFSEIYKEILEIIKDGKKVEEIYEYYCSSKYGYGLRKGVFSFILALIIIKNKSEIVVSTSKNNEELEFTASEINNIENTPQNYKMTFIKFTKEKDIFLDKILEMFKLYIDNKREISKSSQSLKAFKNFLLSLPNLILIKEYEEKTVKKIIKGILAQNNSMEFWFSRLSKIYKTSNYNEIFKLFKKDIDFLRYEEVKLENKIKEIIITNFQLEDEISELKKWSEKEENNSTKYYNWIKNEVRKELEIEKNFLKKLTEKVQGFNYYNWRIEKDIQDFDKNLKEALLIEENLNEKNVMKIVSKNKEKRIAITQEPKSATGKILKSKLISDLKNMGMAVTKKEQNKILLEILMDE